VSLEEVKNITVADLGFGFDPEKSGQGDRTLSPALFQPTVGVLKKLRTMAQEGRADLEKVEEEERGRAKIVWKQSVPEPDFLPIFHHEDSFHEQKPPYISP